MRNDVPETKPLTYIYTVNISGEGSYHGVSLQATVVARACVHAWPQ